MSARWHFALWASLLAGLACAADAKEEAAKELGKFQGTWKLTTKDIDEFEGVLRERDIEGKLIVKGVDYIYLVKVGNGYHELMKGRLELDPRAKPRTIDFLRDDGGHFLGIYEWNGADLKVCFSHLDLNRAKEYKNTTKQNVIILKRE